MLILFQLENIFIEFLTKLELNTNDGTEIEILTSLFCNLSFEKISLVNYFKFIKFEKFSSLTVRRRRDEEKEE